MGAFQVIPVWLCQARGGFCAEGRMQKPGCRVPRRGSAERVPDVAYALGLHPPPEAFVSSMSLSALRTAQPAASLLK